LFHLICAQFWRTNASVYVVLLPLRSGALSGGPGKPLHRFVINETFQMETPLQVAALMQKKKKKNS
jgi:hypothetical protein